MKPESIKKFILISLVSITIAGLAYWVVNYTDILKQKSSLESPASQTGVYPSPPKEFPAEKSAPTVSTINTIRGEEKVEYDSDEINGVVQDLKGDAITINNMQLLLNPNAEVSIVKGNSSTTRQEIATKKVIGSRSDIKVGDQVKGIFINERRTEGIFFLVILRS